MKNFWILLLIVNTVFSLTAFGQEDPSKASEGDLSPKFASQTKEVGIACGEFLPSQIPGMSEVMGLCGGHLGFKIAPKTFLEPQLLAGAGKAQKYLLGSLSFRGDFQIDEMVGSVYGGGDIHYATTPVFNGGVATGDSTNVYFGAHLGGAIWFDLTDNLYFRGDMQFLVNPGTSLFIGFGLVLRFAGGSDQGAPAP